LQLDVADDDIFINIILSLPCWGDVGCALCDLGDVAVIIRSQTYLEVLGNRRYPFITIIYVYDMISMH
jgi:hypothetical protein